MKKGGERGGDRGDVKGREGNWGPKFEVVCLKSYGLCFVKWLQTCPAGESAEGENVENRLDTQEKAGTLRGLLPTGYLLQIGWEGGGSSGGSWKRGNGGGGKTKKIANRKKPGPRIPLLPRSLQGKRKKVNGSKNQRGREPRLRVDVAACCGGIYHH